MRDIHEPLAPKSVLSRKLARHCFLYNLKGSCVSYVMCLPSIQYVTAQTISGTGALRLAGIFLVSQVQLVLEPTLPLFFSSSFILPSPSLTFTYLLLLSQLSVYAPSLPSHSYHSPTPVLFIPQQKFYPYSKTIYLTNPSWPNHAPVFR